MQKFSENRFLLIIGLVQFINILDFMMVMPLGPDFAKYLSIPLQHLGYIGGSYTLAAAISGLFGAVFLDWFDRRKVILISLTGLGVATILPCFARNFEMLIGARVLAGIFGGPLTASALAMVADVIPVARRGTAMGKVMGAFSLASVFGVPFGLELSRLIAWQAPFVTLGIIAFIVFFMARRFLPVGTNTQAKRDVQHKIRQLAVALRSPLAWSAWGYTGFAVLGAFLIIPNVAAHVQYNMGFPRDHLGLLYLAGGGLSFFSMRMVGKWVDKSGATFVSTATTVLFSATVYFGFINYQHFSAYALFIGFMVANSARNVAGQALSSEVPMPVERAGYMSIQTTITHTGCAVGAFIGSMILVQGADQKLHHVESLGWLSIVISLLIPVLFWNTERLLKKRPVSVQPDAVAAGLPDMLPD